MRITRAMCFLRSMAIGLFAMFLLAGCPTVAATCTAATFTGNYAAATLGVEGGVPATTLFRLTSDGVGKLSGAGAENINGTAQPGVTASGTFTINPNCWITLTITDSLGTTRSLAGAVFQNGAEIVGVSTSTGTLLQFTAYRQTLTSCTIATAAGNYVGEVQSPLTPYGPSVGTNQFKVNKLGQGTGSWVGNFSGTIAVGTATVTFSINSDCTFTSTVVSNNGPTTHSFGVGGILHNDVATLFIGIDSGWVSLATGYKK